MCLGLFQRKPVQKPPEFASGDLFYFIGILRPPETAFLQPLIVEPESVLVPLQNLDLAFVFAAENKHGSAERIQLEVLFHQTRESVDLFPHVGCPACQINRIGSADLYHGFCTAERTSRRVPASNPFETSTAISRMCMYIFPVARSGCGSSIVSVDGICAQPTGASNTRSHSVNAALSLIRFFQYFIRSYGIS